MDYRNVGKCDGWAYILLLPVIHLEFKILFRKIYWHNRKGVPANKPVLIAANHPTAFVDPLFFCIFLDPPVYNMTRGDIFRKPIFRRLLWHCNMFPVYRQRDGYDRRDRNDEVFEYCDKKLRDGVAVNIFVEGEHHIDKRVLGLQKGIARIAFGSYERKPMDDLQVVPIGCNYNYGDQHRDEAKIIVGSPIFIKDYWEQYLRNPAGAILQLCNDIRAQLLQLCYHVEDKNDDLLADQLLTLWRNDHPGNMLPIVEHQAERFFEEKKLLARMNEMSAESKEALKLQCQSYFEALSGAGMTDEILVRSGYSHWTWSLLFVLGFIPFVAGAILRWPIQAFANYMEKNKAKKREYKTSIWVGISTLSTAFYYALLFSLGVWCRAPSLVSLAILTPVLAWFSIFWWERLQYWMAVRKAWRHPDRAELLVLRSKIAY